MTTIISIAGRDPQSREPYVVMAGDSIAFSEKGAVSNIRKIFASENGNYAIGTTGKDLRKFFSKVSQKNLYDVLNNPKQESKETIESALMQMQEILLRDVGDDNGYLASFSETAPEIYMMTKTGLKPTGKPYAVIGAGMYFAEKLGALNSFVRDGRVEISKKESLDCALEEINSIASKTFSSGGMMDAAIVSSMGVIFKPNYAKIHSPNSTLVHSLDNSPSGLHPHYMYDD